MPVELTPAKHSVEDVCALIVHQPVSPDLPEPMYATIVNARTFLHVAVPRPSGPSVYEALTIPGRRPAEVVPLSTIAQEVGGESGDLDGHITGWLEAVSRVLELAWNDQCDSLRVGLGEGCAELLQTLPGPDTVEPGSGHSLHDHNGPRARQAEIDLVQADIDAHLKSGPLWPGAPLVYADFPTTRRG